jgi:hypothetical protein
MSAPPPPDAATLAAGAELLVAAAYDNNLPQLRLLLAAGMAANAVRPSRSMRALHAACTRSHFEAASLLLQAGKSRLRGGEGR